MKKSKTILLIIALAANLVLVQMFKIKITFQQVLTIQIFLFTLSLLTEIIQVKFSENKKITPAHFLTINFLKLRNINNPKKNSNYPVTNFNKENDSENFNFQGIDDFDQPFYLHAKKYKIINKS